MSSEFGSIVVHARKRDRGKQLYGSREVKDPRFGWVSSEGHYANIVGHSENDNRAVFNNLPPGRYMLSGYGLRGVKTVDVHAGLTTEVDWR